MVSTELRGIIEVLADSNKPFSFEFLEIDVLGQSFELINKKGLHSDANERQPNGLLMSLILFFWRYL